MRERKPSSQKDKDILVPQGCYAIAHSGEQLVTKGVTECVVLIFRLKEKPVALIHFDECTSEKDLDQSVDVITQALGVSLSALQIEAHTGTSKAMFSNQTYIRNYRTLKKSKLGGQLPAEADKYSFSTLCISAGGQNNNTRVKRWEEVEPRIRYTTLRESFAMPFFSFGYWINHFRYWQAGWFHTTALVDSAEQQIVVTPTYFNKMLECRQFSTTNMDQCLLTLHAKAEEIIVGYLIESALSISKKVILKCRPHFFQEVLYTDQQKLLHEVARALLSQKGAYQLTHINLNGKKIFIENLVS